MISYSTVLNSEDWKNLNGNDLFVQMLRNKVIVEIPKVTKVKQNSDDYRVKEDDSLQGVLFDYIKTVPEDLVHYNVEDVYGHKTIYVYFANPTDKENFYHYYNTVYSMDKVTK
jgi:hypothetical protein